MQELTMASFPENTNERPLRLYDGPECQPEDECFKASHVAPGGIFSPTPTSRDQTGSTFQLARCVSERELCARTIKDKNRYSSNEGQEAQRTA